MERETLASAQGIGTWTHNWRDADFERRGTV